MRILKRILKICMMFSHLCWSKILDIIYPVLKFICECGIEPPGSISHGVSDCTSRDVKLKTWFNSFVLFPSFTVSKKIPIQSFAESKALFLSENVRTFRRDMDRFLGVDESKVLPLTFFFTKSLILSNFIDTRIFLQR